MKILILKPSSLGDVVQALPVLRLIKRRHPHAQVHWWLESSLTPLLERTQLLTHLLLICPALREPRLSLNPNPQRELQLLP